MALNAFQPQGNTILFTATTSTPAGAVQVCTGGQQAMWIENQSSAQNVYVTFGSSTIVAAVPTTGTPATGMAIPPLGAHAFTVPPKGYLSACTSAGSINVFATPGFGL